jgi:RNA polymerase sigma-70 factor (ECF subfamily)
MTASRSTSDDAVISGAKQAQPHAWRELYALVSGRLTGWLRTQSMLDPALDVDDLANEAWMIAARRIAEFTGDTDDFAGWMFVIARNLVVNANRRSMRRNTIPTDVDPRLLESEPVGDDSAVDVDATDWVRRLMSHLSPREYDVVALVDVAGLDMETTSRLLGISRTAVKVAHHRAMKRLQSVLASQSGGTTVGQGRNAGGW